MKRPKREKDYTTSAEQRRSIRNTPKKRRKRGSAKHRRQQRRVFSTYTKDPKRRLLIRLLLLCPIWTQSLTSISSATCGVQTNLWVTSKAKHELYQSDSLWLSCLPWKLLKCDWIKECQAVHVTLKLSSFDSKLVKQKWIWKLMYFSNCIHKV